MLLVLLPHTQQCLVTFAKLCVTRVELHHIPCRLPSADTFDALTRLTLLSIHTVGEQDDDFYAAMQATLPQLPQLQHLRCNFYHNAYAMNIIRLPPALTHLTNLRRLWWDIDAYDTSLPDPNDEWLQGLSSLGLTPEAIIANHSRLLEGTPHLESLHVLCKHSFVNWPAMDLVETALQQFAVMHTSLQHVHLHLQYPAGFDQADLQAKAVAHVQQAQQQRPDVRFSSCGLLEAGPAFGDEST